MANISKWTGVGVSMSAAPATAINITAIANAATATVTATNTFTAGDYVVLNVQGTTQLNGRVFRVASPTGTNFVLEAEDTTLYGTFISGTVQKLTWATTLSTLTTVSGTGGDYDFVDTTTIHDKQKSQIPGIASAVAYTFESIWDIANASLVALKAASDNQLQRAFMITFQNGQRSVFYGYVGTSLIPSGSTGGMVQTKVTITATGGQTNLAS